MSNNIILIGFMGVGKGRTARELASISGRFAVDTDDLIESMVKMKIRSIFKEHGESWFRQIEQQTANWIEYHLSGTVVSTGGGFFQVKNISRLGQVVYLHAPVESILESMANHPRAKKKLKKRPLLSDLKQAGKLFTKRLPGYRHAADVEINVVDRDISDVALEIADRIRR